VADDRLVIRADAISDELWELIEPVLPSRKGLRGRPFADHRLILEGIAWRYRAGTPWRDVPAEFGPWQTVWKHHHRFSIDGTYQRIFDVVRSTYGIDDSDDSDDLAQLLSVDSTVVRAHQHAAGAPTVPGRALAAATDHASGHTGGGVE
jgi:putative transposase